MAVRLNSAQQQNCSEGASLRFIEQRRAGFGFYRQSTSASSGPLTREARAVDVSTQNISRRLATSTLRALTFELPAVGPEFAFML